MCLCRNVFSFARSDWWKLLESFPSNVSTKNRQKSWKVKVCWNLFEMSKCVRMYQAHKLMYLTCDFSSDTGSKFYLVRNHIFLLKNHSIWIKQTTRKFFFTGSDLIQLKARIASRLFESSDGVHTTWKKCVKTHLEMKTFSSFAAFTEQLFFRALKNLPFDVKSFFCAF